MSEEWRDVVGYEGHYEVSNLGRVRSCNKWKGNRWGTKTFLPMCMMTPGASMGYLHVLLWKDKKRKTCLVHGLVAAAFIGPRAEGLEVDHINKDRGDNRLENLRYLTRWNNSAKRKLNFEQALEIRARRWVEKPTRTAREFGVTCTLVARIQDGRAW